jgi:hypothetical protein
MKVRTGFVSNSSSSSFCVFGRSYRLDRSKDVDGFDKILENLGYKDRMEDFKDDDSELDEFLIQVGKMHNLVIRYGGESNTIYCGGDYADVEGSETFDEFRSRIKSILVPECEHINQVIDCAD